MTEGEKRQVAAAITIGCDRTTAAAYIGVTEHELATQLQTDPEFAKQVRKAEAAVELSHLKNVHNAVQDPKNWRASVWYLKSRRPESYDRKQHTLNDQELSEFVGRLMDALHDLVPKDQHAQLAERIGRLLSAVA